MRNSRRMAATAIAALVGWCVGWLGGAVDQGLQKPSFYAFLARPVPLPHHVPQYPDGISFRFAMAHDVIHQRFPRHGEAHYRERNRLTREALEKLAPDDPARFPLADDLAAGLERLGRSDEAAAVMREKLTRQQERGLSGRDLYTSYANLGTFLIHGNFKQAASGDGEARKRFLEGVELVRKSVEVNPEAHFGRERWQAAIAEFLLATMDRPELLKTFDCLGNRLDRGIQEILDRERFGNQTDYGRPYDVAFADGDVDLPASFVPGVRAGSPELWPKLSPIRQHITKVGAEEGWKDVPVPSHRDRVPFDEPVLGMIGMWRQGGGANPHFALALGETMLRAGQRFIAWDAYERAYLLADKYSADPVIQEFLRTHCRERQRQIENTFENYVGSVAPLRTKFHDELAYGEFYQKAYQDFEAARIANGVSIDDPHFFDEFSATHDPIASPSGSEEMFYRVPDGAKAAYVRKHRNIWGLFCAGLAAITTASLLSLRHRPKPAAPPPHAAWRPLD